MVIGKKPRLRSGFVTDKTDVIGMDYIKLESNIIGEGVLNLIQRKRN